MSPPDYRDIQKRLSSLEARALERIRIAQLEVEQSEGKASSSRSPSREAFESDLAFASCPVCPSVRKERQKSHGEALVFDVQLLKFHKESLCARCSCARVAWTCLEESISRYLWVSQRIQHRIPRTKLLWYKSGKLRVRPWGSDRDWWDVTSMGSSGMFELHISRSGR